MRKILPCLLAVGIVAITGCKKEGPAGSGPGVVAADDPLTFVPADTPYVIANIDPQPADVGNYWIGKLDKGGKVGDIYSHQIDAAIKLIANANANCPQASAGGGGGAMQDASASASDSGDAGDQADAAGEASSQAADGTNAAAAVAPADASATTASGEDKCSAASIAEREKMTKLLGAVKEEVAGKDVKGLMDLAGIVPQTHAAIFGIGLVPVMRIELAKPDNLRATIGRLETKSGSKLATGKVGNLDFWRFGGDDGKLEVVMAISGKQFVATIAPVKASDADLKTLFGLDKPKKSLADSGDLAALNQKMKYLSYGSGYFDSAKLVAVLKAPPTPLETSFLTAIGEKKPQLDAVCAGEYSQLAAAWPRASFGYTDLSTQHMGLRMVLETRADIAKDLMTLRAPLPGMAAAQNALVDFGFSADLTKLPSLATKYADATAKSPWKCPALVGFNQSAEQMKSAATNPGFAGYAPMFHGFHAIVDKIEPKDAQPIPDFSAVIAISSDNPASLLALASSASPGIVNLGLKPDGVAKPLPAMPNLPVQAPMFAAMTDKILAIAIGAGEDAKIADAMKTDPAQQPVFAGGGRGEVYHLIADMMRKNAQSMGDAEAQQSMQEQAAVMDMYAGFIKRVDITTELTEQGIELHEGVSLQ
ncbi:MAG TPA: hypothetical protein VGH80_06120 [Xanthomonadaceae bacterium]|jgi:hypothetical protein